MNGFGNLPVNQIVKHPVLKQLIPISMISRMRKAIPSGMVCLPLVAHFLAGCSAKYYHNQADEQVYKIIRSIEHELYGKTNEFSIDTKYSVRDPESILAPEIIGDRQEEGQLTLTLSDALELAASQSRTYQTEKEQLYLTALSLTSERHNFNPRFFAGSTAAYSGVVEDGGDGTLSVRSQAGVDQLLKSGGSLGLTLANDLFKYYTGNTSRDISSVISVNLFQPLLQGFGKNSAAVERLTQASRDVVYAVRSYSYFQQGFAIEIVGDYFDLLGQKNIIVNNYSNFVSQVDSTRRLEARYDAGEETVTGVDLAKQSELTSRNNYVNSVANYFNSIDQFKIKLGIPLNVRVFLDDDELAKLAETGLIPVIIDSEKAFELATDQQAEILNAIDVFEDAKRKIGIAADQLRTRLDFFGNASLPSSGQTDYTNFDIDDLQYSFGLELDLPIDRLNERNNYRATLVSFESAIRRLALDLDNLKDSIERGLRTLEQRRQNFIIQQNALQLARRRVLSNQLQLEAGRVQVRDLVESQNDLIDAQNSLTVSLVSYQDVRLQLLHTLGVINTELDDFWFEAHLDAFPEIVLSERPDSLTSGEELPTPEQVFTN